jgi:thiamine monophosphate synthase
VFEENGGAISDGLEKLRRVCEKPDRAASVLALGGVTLGNVGQCIAASADGIFGCSRKMMLQELSSDCAEETFFEFPTDRCNL